MCKWSSRACIVGNGFRFCFRLVQPALALGGQFCGPSLGSPRPILCRQQNPSSPHLGYCCTVLICVAQPRPPSPLSLAFPNARRRRARVSVVLLPRLCKDEGVPVGYLFPSVGRSSRNHSIPRFRFVSCSFPLALHVLYVVADSLCFASCFSWFGAQDLW